MHDTTFHGLHKWHERMFEKLGWMVLAKSHGRDLKIAAYLDGIQHLKTSLEEAKGHYQEADRRHDIDILHKNVMELEKAAKTLLGRGDSSRHRTKKSNSHVSHGSHGSRA